jgi:hypothetical protein
MKKLFLIATAALCFVAIGCKKTCQCTETVTVTYDSDEDWDFFPETPDVSTAHYTKEAKKCADLNGESVVNSGFAHTKGVIECK